MPGGGTPSKIEILILLIETSNSITIKWASSNCSSETNISTKEDGIHYSEAVYQHFWEEHIVNRLKNDRLLHGELRNETFDYNELYRLLYRPINTKENSQLVYDLLNSYNGKKTTKKLCVSGNNYSEV